MEKSIAKAMIGVALLAVSTLVQAGSGWASVNRSLRLYDTISPHEIVWGQESEPGELRAPLDPALYTASPGRVEIIEFVRYPQDVWRRSQVLTNAWLESLPDGVVVRRVPFDLKAGQMGKRIRPQLLIDQQRVYYAAELLGVEDAAHAALLASGERGDTSVRRAVAEVVSSTGVDAAEFERLRRHELMRSKTQTTRSLVSSQKDALWWAGLKGDVPWLFPELLVNGKYAVSASRMGDPRAAYRLANRLIREELERGGAEAGPTTNEEYAQWMMPRAGEVLKPVYAGHVANRFGVFSPARSDVWVMDDTGKVYGAYRLHGEGERSYWKMVTGSVHYLDMWRLARQYQSFERPDGTAQKYGAFLLMERLCAPDTHWVVLRFKGRDVGLAFDRCKDGEGRVEGRNDNGSIFGSWWLEAGELKVSFGEGGIQSWPWRDVAKQVGWEIPPESLTPWRFEEGYAERKTEEAARSAGSER